MSMSALWAASVSCDQDRQRVGVDLHVLAVPGRVPQDLDRGDRAVGRGDLHLDRAPAGLDGVTGDRDRGAGGADVPVSGASSGGCGGRRGRETGADGLLPRGRDARTWRCGSRTAAPAPPTVLEAATGRCASSGHHRKLSTWRCSGAAGRRPRRAGRPRRPSRRGRRRRRRARPGPGRGASAGRRRRGRRPSGAAMPGDVDDAAGRARRASTASSRANSGRSAYRCTSTASPRPYASPSASARSGVMPTPAPIRATLRRVRVRAVRRP